MQIIYIIIILLVLYMIYYYPRRYYYLVHMRNAIFPFKISDMKLNPDMSKEKDYARIKNALFINPSTTEMVYLLKYKKFVDEPNVYSMCGNNEIDQLKKLLIDVIEKKVNGCLVETGAWRGGMGMWMQSILKYYRDNRNIWLFDTFEYFPQPSNSKDRSIHEITNILFEKMQNTNEVKNNFVKNGLFDKNIRLVEGEFTKTIPITNTGPIAILRLDSDYYDSTMLVLENYYWKISKRGYIIIDDYSNTYLACKDAVDDFRLKYNITELIINKSNGSVYWQII